MRNFWLSLFVCLFAYHEKFLRYNCRRSSRNRTKHFYVFAEPEHRSSLLVGDCTSVSRENKLLKIFFPKTIFWQQKFIADSLNSDLRHRRLYVVVDIFLFRISSISSIIQEVESYNASHIHFDAHAGSTEYIDTLLLIIGFSLHTASLCISQHSKAGILSLRGRFRQKRLSF